MNLSWLNSRKSGFLLHLTALPTGYGIGNLGNCTREWLDLLKACVMRYWQICPVGPTGFGNSPYSSLSAFAGNPLLIDFESLVSVGLLESKQISRLQGFSQDNIGFVELDQIVADILTNAFREFMHSNKTAIRGYGSFTQFQESEASWLDDYCLYRALKTRFDEQPWYNWPNEFRCVHKA